MDDKQLTNCDKLATHNNGQAATAAQILMENNDKKISQTEERLFDQYAKIINFMIEMIFIHTSTLLLMRRFNNNTILNKYSRKGWGIE